MNSEIYINLGKRIRDRRKELKLTQAEVSGKYITRNMLSRIETGNACPSIDTLVYLADVLKMPVEYFLSKDTESAALYKKVEYITQIRALFKNGLYKKCIDVCESIDTDDSEIYLLKAESELKLASENMMVCKLTTAESFLDQCEISAKKCLYNEERISSTARFYRQLIHSVKENKYPSFSIFSEKNIILVEGEFIVFAYALIAMQNDILLSQAAIESVSSPVYKNFLKAASLISERSYLEAVTLLNDVLKMQPGFFTLYFTTQNLELCYKEMGDFKNAYKYAKMRLDLLDKFND